MGQHKSPKNFLDQCMCDKPGFCPIFNRMMGTDPPDWHWCRNSCTQDRESYYELLCKAPPTQNYSSFELLERVLKSDLDNRFYLLYYLTLNDKYHRCERAQRYQEHKTKEIISYIQNTSIKKNNLEDIQILSLGHSHKQFDSIEDRPYITKVNLNDIDAGEFSDNKWAESRAFLSNEQIFHKHVKFVGLTTASWNIKYKNYSRIDNFHNWYTAPVLLNSEPEDRIVLCADIFCPCIWFESQDNVLSVFFGQNYPDVANLFVNIFGFSVVRHAKVPFSNQMILHRNNYQKYVDYLINNEIPEKVSYFIGKVKKYIDRKKDISYSLNRLHAYILEMISTFWFLEQDFLYIPNAERKETWYDQKEIQHRTNKWKNTIS